MKKAVNFLGKALAVLFLAAFVFGCKQVTEEKTYYLNTYTVEFDANGGSGTMKAQTFCENRQQALSKNAFEAPDGSQFAGWALEPLAGSAEIEYTDTQTVTVKENMTLYAVWKMIEGRGTNTEAKNFQFVFDDWQTTDESVKPGDDFYEYSVGQFLNLDILDQFEKSPVFNVRMDALQFLNEQAMNPSFNLGKIYKELYEEEQNNSAILDYLQTEIDKIDAVKTVSEYYELFADYMWQDMPYMVFDISFNGRKPIVSIMANPSITTFELDETFEAYYNQSEAESFYKALQNSELTQLSLQYKTDENSVFYKIIQCFKEETGISDFDLKSSFSINDKTADALKHFDLISEEKDIDSPDKNLTLENAKQFLCFIAAKKCYDNYNSETLKINQYQFYYPLVKEYQKKVDPDGTRKEYIEQMCHEIIEAFSKRIEKNPWMSETAKKNAKKKAENILVLVGYPEQFPEEFLYENTKRQERGWNCTAQMFNDLTKEINKLFYKRTFSNKVNIEDKIYDAFILSNNTIMYNASYSCSLNSIFVNIAALNEKILSLDKSDAYNYGFFGSTLAHELCHAFDSTGAQYGPDGERLEWWTISDKLRYKEKKNQMINLYNQFVISSDGSSVSGERTLDENLADLGGITISYDAFLSKKINELTDVALMEQRKVFFQSYAIYYAVPDNGDWENDEHAPDEFRTKGIVCNIDDWYNLYNVSFGDVYYLSPDQRIILW